jgi:hypothetical protein
VGHRADLRNLRSSHTSLSEALTKNLPLKDKKKRKSTGQSPKPPGETELLLKYTTNRERNELRMKIDNIKEEVNHDMENFRKKNEIEIQNTMEGNSSRVEQAEDRISELEDEMKLKAKLKSYYSNNSRPVKVICKNSLTPSKDQT